MELLYRQSFPRLTNIDQKKTSPHDVRYNCVAWAFEDNRLHWWPNKERSFWPLDATGKTTSEAFEEWFAKDGWSITTDDKVENGFKKIALFALFGEPTHAARLLPNGLWTSKLGPGIDLFHELEELTGPLYGIVHKIYRKPVSG